MTFRPDAVEPFLKQFDAVAPQIRRFEGCGHLELWSDTRFPNCCTTYSHWVDEDALDAYRDSELFRTTWDRVKPLFAAPPQAQSYAIQRPAAAINEAVSNEAMRNAAGGSDD